MRFGLPPRDRPPDRRPRHAERARPADRGDRPVRQDGRREPAAFRPRSAAVAGPRGTVRTPRRGAGLTPARAGALLVLLATAVAAAFLVGSDAFAADRVAVDGATWTSPAAIRAAARVPAGQNLFTLATGPVAARVRALPAVRSARVEVALPGDVRIVVAERQALVVWQAGERRFLVDEEGVAFAELGTDPAGDPPATAALPVVLDARVAVPLAAAGDRLDPVTLDAALRLASLTPPDVGSTAAGLTVRLDDADGFALVADTGWTAVFGFYTRTLRPTDLVPGQVRLLRSLLVGREPVALRIVLADDRNGTWIPRPTPKPTRAP